MKLTISKNLVRSSLHQMENVNSLWTVHLFVEFKCNSNLKIWILFSLLSFCWRRLNWNSGYNGPHIYPMFCGILDPLNAPPHSSIQVATPRAATRRSSGRRWSPSRARPPWCGTGNQHHYIIMSCQVYYGRKGSVLVSNYRELTRPHSPAKIMVILNP